MGFMDKLKGGLKSGLDILKNGTPKQQEEKKKKEEAERKQEEAEREAERFDPRHKDLEWFSSEDGLKAFEEYTSIQCYMLEEKARKEWEDKYKGEYEFDIFFKAFYEGKKIPSIYFESLADYWHFDFDPGAFMIASILSLQAKPYKLDNDGEPKVITPKLTPEEIVSVEKNPVLNFVDNFFCFDDITRDDEQGSMEDKFQLYWDVAWFLWYESSQGKKDVLAKNKWIFDEDVYLNNLGMVRKELSFFKKVIPLCSDSKWFARKLQDIEEN